MKTTPVGSSLIQNDTLHLVATQFFSTKTISLPVDQALDKLTLELDPKHPELFIGEINLEMKQGYMQRRLQTWKGNSIEQLLLDTSVIASKNNEFIRLRSSKGMAIPFRTSTLNPLYVSLFSKTTIYVFSMCAALLLSLFILSAFTVLRIKQALQLNIQWKTMPLLVPAFGFILLLTMLNSVFKIIPDKKSNENRAMASLAPPSKDNLFQYPDQLIQYTNDHFAFRNHLFSFHSLLRSKFLHASSLPNEVIAGKDGWFFKYDPFAIADVRKLSNIPESSLLEMATVLKERIDWLKEKGIRYYIVIPPNPERIYREHYPDEFSVVAQAGHDRLDYYKKYLLEQHQIELIDPTDSLMKYKQFHDVYYSTDTHWNLFGAWVTYYDLMQHIKKDFPCIRPITFDQLAIESRFAPKGDLAAMLGLEEVYKRLEIDLKLKDSTQRLEQSTTSDIVQHYRNAQRIDSCKLKAMVFRDSYGNYLLPFLNKHFEECTYVWTYNFMHEMILEEQPDIVILEAQQRVLFYALHAPNLFH